jgi:medium-chain acyl-[acyl-carrier-protein] hydrolase
MSHGPNAAGPWLPSWRARAGAALRRFCFPYAGGDVATFAPWAEVLPWDIELCPVQLPGRGRRALEPAYAALGPLVDALAGGLRPALAGRFAFFGHSMGALVCFELARALRRRGGPLPCHLLVSGRPAPQLPRRYGPLSQLPDRELVDQLHRRYGYAPPQDDGQLDELLRLMIPTVRSDVAVSDAYGYPDEPPLDCPITAFGGLDDATVTRDELAAWGAQTRGRFEIRMLPGGHFYLESEWRFLVRFIATSLQSALAARREDHPDE